MLNVIIVSANDGLIWLFFSGNRFGDSDGPTRGRYGRNQSILVNYPQFSAELC